MKLIGIKLSKFYKSLLEEEKLFNGQNSILKLKVKSLIIGHVIHNTDCTHQIKAYVNDIS